MDLHPLLRYIRRFVVLTPDEETLLLSKVTQRRYLKGQYVVQQGDVCQTETFVLSGCLKTFYVDNDGQEHIVRFAIEDWWTGDLGSFITQTPADYSVQCLENTECIQISYDALESIYASIPKMERFFRLIIQKAYVASEKRVIRNFSLPAKERYLLFQKQYPQLEQRVPQYMIASFLGITKEFLSKIRSQLIDEQ